MTLPDILRKIWPPKDPPPRKRTSQWRNYAAANNSRLTEDWIFGPADANAELKGGLGPIRERAREAERNNNIVRRYLSMCEINTIGRGVKLQMRSKFPDGTPDDNANTAIEQAWSDWCQRFATVNGMTLTEAARLGVRTERRDGEIIVSRLWGADNPHRYTLRLLEADYIDHEYNGEYQGRRIYMGVEMDDFGVPVAYWLDRYHPGDKKPGRDKGKRIRHEVNDTRLIFRPDRPGQIRGISSLAAALVGIHNLNGAIEAEIIGTRVAASKMGFFIPRPGADMTEIDDGDDVRAPVMDASPGSFQVLPSEWDLREWNPQFPNSNFGVFATEAKRDIASGLDVSYNTLANDLNGVNYSSLREGKLVERDRWMVDQDFWVNNFYRWVFAGWLKMWLMTDLTKLPASKYDKFLADIWQPRRWAWVDPLKDMQALALAREHNWTSDSTIVSDQGQDLEDVYAQIRKDAQLAAGLPAPPAGDENA